MKSFTRNVLVKILIFLLLSVAVCYAQTVKVNAGEHKIINWHETHSVKINGKITPNLEVFKDIRLKNENNIK